MAEHSTFWCIAVLCRDEELNSQETTQEEDLKGKDILEFRGKKCICFQRAGCQIADLQRFG